MTVVENEHETKELHTQPLQLPSIQVIADAFSLPSPNLNQDLQSRDPKPDKPGRAPGVPPTAPIVAAAPVELAEDGAVVVVDATTVLVAVLVVDVVVVLIEVLVLVPSAETTAAPLRARARVMVKVTVVGTATILSRASGPLGL
ncbi:uncharacterized protein PG986_004575 [Apiospora aurea]|uniref:Uncharacterized protein n=1 Tax=Apiospora aurea TaxID=335848 RepID=A0ABR1QMZ7_9PEZI